MITNHVKSSEMRVGEKSEMSKINRIKWES